MKRCARLLALALGLATGLVGRADPLVAVVESPAFNLDLRLTRTDAGGDALVVQTVSPAFTLDTRLANGVNLVSAVVVESGTFTLDTRVSVGTSGAGLVASMQSPAFTLDTRVSPSNPILGALVVQAKSSAFTLDTRLTPANPILATLVVSRESSAFTLDTQSGWVKTIFTTLAPYAGGGRSGKARFSPDGQQLAKADGTRIVLWNLQDTRSPVLFSGAPAAVTTVDFSPLGDQLLTGSGDGLVRWWDTASRAVVGQLSPEDGVLAYAAWSADGARLLAGAGTNLHLYSYPATNQLQAFAGISNQISSVALSPDGTRALAGTADRTVTIWNTSNGQLARRLAGHVGLITAAAFYPGGSDAMTASLDGTLRVWDCSQGTEKFQITQNAPVADAVLSADGTLIASCNNGNPGRAFIWDGQSGALMRVFSDTSPDSSTRVVVGNSSDSSQMTGVALSPDHTMLCTTHADGRVLLWDTGLQPQPTLAVTPLLVGTNVPVTLRSHGVYYFAMDALAGRSMVVTLEAAGGSATAKALKSPDGVTQAAGLSPDAEFANVGGAAPANLRLKTLRAFPFSTDLTAFRMTATKGRLPSEYDYEAFAQASVTNLHCEMPLAATVSQKCYVLVFAPYLSAGTITARIRAEFVDFHLSSVTPARGGNSGNVTAKLQGTGITPETAVRLVNGGTSIPGQLAMWADSTKAWFTFALSNAPVANYSLELSRAGFAPVTLSNAFGVVTGVGPLLQTRLDTPAAVRPGRDYSMTVSYANVGDVDVAAPLLMVSAQNLNPWMYPLSGINPNAAKLGRIGFLGITSEGPAGVLSPGTENEVPVYFQAPNDRSVASMTFNLDITPADSTPIDWASRKDLLRPPTLDPGVWDVVFANLTSELTNNAAYVRMLDDNAQYLSQLGKRVIDVDSLWNFELQQAYGFTPVSMLDSTVDAFLPAPGVTLEFSRHFSSNLRARNSLGPFGHGWYTPWQATLVQNGTVAQLIGEAGSARTFTYSTNGNYLSATGDSSNLNSLGGGVAELHDPNGIVTRFRVDGKIDYVQDPNGNRVTAGYGSAGRLDILSHTSGASIAITYNGAGLVQTVSDSAGRSLTYAYDVSNSYLESVTTDDGKVTRYAYNMAGPSAQRHALTSVNRGGTTRHFTFDTHGRLASNYLAGGEQLITFAYDSAGGVSLSNAQGTTRLYFDHRAVLAKTVDPLGNATTPEFDDNLNLIRIVTPTGESRSYSWCDCGSLTSVTDELGHTTTFGRNNAFKRLTSFTDARNNTIAYAYDGAGNLLSTTYADNSVEWYGNYSASGLPQKRVNRRGQTITYNYTPAGQLNRQAFEDGSYAGFDYDPRGNLVKITEHPALGTNKVTSYRYEYATDGDRLRRVTYPNGRWVAFTYDAFGRRQTISDNTGQANRYEYDPVGRLWLVSDATNAPLVEYAYNAAGRLQRVNKGNGTYTAYEYDPSGQVLRLINWAATGAVNSRFDYTYDSRGRRRTMSTLDGDWAYDYDGAGRLTRAAFASRNGAIPHQDLSYNYDAGGNRASAVVDGITTKYAINSGNQYLTVGGSQYKYDEDGNLTFDGVRNYEYDAQSRLVWASGPEGITEYEYDALGYRTAMRFNGQRTEYLLDPTALVQVIAEYDGTGNLAARFSIGRGLNSQHDATGNTFYYECDALGSVVGVTDISGSNVNRYVYAPFGSRVFSVATVQNPFQFIGRFGVTAEPNDLSYMSARFYGAHVGRFNSLDPLAFGPEGPMSYSYSRNDPVGRLDPAGTEDEPRSPDETFGDRCSRALQCAKPYFIPALWWYCLNNFNNPLPEPTPSPSPDPSPEPSPSSSSLWRNLFITSAYAGEQVSNLGGGGAGGVGAGGGWGGS